MAMPFDEMHSMLNEDDRIRIAGEGEMYTDFEVWFVSNDVEREAMSNTLTIEFDDSEINIGPLELQIAYKLRLAQRAGSLTRRDVARSPWDLFCSVRRSSAFDGVPRYSAWRPTDTRRQA